MKTVQTNTEYGLVPVMEWSESRIELCHWQQCCD